MDAQAKDTHSDPDSLYEICRRIWRSAFFLRVRFVMRLWSIGTAAWYLYVGMEWTCRREKVPIAGRTRFAGLPAVNHIYDALLNGIRAQIFAVQTQESLKRQSLAADDPDAQRARAIFARLRLVAGQAMENVQLFLPADPGEHSVVSLSHA